MSFSQPRIWENAKSFCGMEFLLEKWIQTNSCKELNKHITTVPYVKEVKHDAPVKINPLSYFSVYVSL